MYKVLIVVGLFMLVGCGNEERPEPTPYPAIEFPEPEPDKGQKCVTYYETKRGADCDECSTDCMKIVVCTPIGGERPIDFNEAPGD